MEQAIIYPEREATPVPGAIGLDITTVTGRQISYRGEVRYHEGYACYYCLDACLGWQSAEGMDASVRMDETIQDMTEDV